MDVTKLTKDDWGIIKNALAESLKSQERKAKNSSNEIVAQAHAKVADAIRNTMGKL